MTLNLPNSFTEGTLVRASEFNENFVALRDAVNQNSTDVATNLSSIENLETNAADKNGDANELFSVADATANAHAVNKSQLDSAMNSIKPIYSQYTVLSAYTDANGYPAFIYKVDDNTVGFYVDDETSYKPLRLSLPSGVEIEKTSVSNVSGLTADGTYIILYDKVQDAVIATQASVTEGYGAASSGSAGDYYLNIGLQPYSPEYNNAGTWEAREFVKLGEVTKVSGTLGTPISYAFNGVSINNTPVSFNLASNYYVNHNIGVAQGLYETSLFVRENSNYQWSRNEFHDSNRGQAIGQTTNISSFVRTGTGSRFTDGHVRAGATSAYNAATGQFISITKRMF